MNSKVLNTIVFISGVTVGSVITWKMLDKKYAEKSRCEVESVKEAFRTKVVSFKTVVTTEDSDARIKKEEPSEVLSEIKAEVKKVYEKIVSDAGYTNYSEFSKNPDTDEDEDEDDLPKHEQPEDDESSVYLIREGAAERPYVIPPDDFDSQDDFDVATLTYFSDGILADEMDNMIEAVDTIVGLDSLDHFGEYEDDSVYVRNEQLKCDYEILLDLRRWEDVVNPPKVKTRPEVPKKPHQMED